MLDVQLKLDQNIHCDYSIVTLIIMYLNRPSGSICTSGILFNDIECKMLRAVTAQPNAQFIKIFLKVIKIMKTCTCLQESPLCYLKFVAKFIQFGFRQ